MNNIGVALAADSAVTLGGEIRKIYTSADKLFQLSTVAPVGVMFYGGADFIGLPWETIIKAFRDDLGSQRYPTLRAYADRFLRFLAGNRRMFGQAAQDREVQHIVLHLFQTAAMRVRWHLERSPPPRGKPIEPVIRATLSRVVTEYLVEVRRNEALPGMPRVRILRRYRRGFEQSLSEVFAGLPPDADTKRRLILLAVEYLRRRVCGIIESGIVIAGFGDDSYVPELLETSVEGMLFGHPRYCRHPHRVIGKQTNAYIVPFAQQEMVQTFMEGVDGFLLSMMEESTSSLIGKVVDTIMREVGRRDPRTRTILERKLEPMVEKLLRQMLKDWDELRDAHSTQPIMNAVAALPKDELGAIAEALIYITRVKRRVSAGEEETVGGPIDVAVITKGDGFVWIKRKHYFDAALNPRAMARFRGEA